MKLFGKRRFWIDEEGNKVGGREEADGSVYVLDFKEHLTPLEKLLQQTEKDDPQYNVWRLRSLAVQEGKRWTPWLTKQEADEFEVILQQIENLHCRRQERIQAEERVILMSIF